MPCPDSLGRPATGRPLHAGDGTLRITTRYLSGLGASVLLAGCTSVPLDPVLAQKSVEYTGCPVKDNMISNQQHFISGYSWTATCKGMSYACTTLANNEHSTETSCTATP